MSNANNPTAPGIIATVTEKVGHYRWTICALLFFATTINYMDRQVLGLLKPLLMKDLGWTETDFGDIVAVFSFMYALGYAGMGRFMDKVGVKIGLPIAVAGWSLCACLHGLMSSVLGFKIMRGGLGITEGGNFPASIKTIAEWFPAKERALATGIFNAGSNIGAVVTPIILPFIVMAFGWQLAFVVVGATGFVWVICWMVLYEHPEKQKRLKERELAYIRSDPIVPTQRVPWLSLFAYRGTWAFVAGMLMVNSVWWFYLNWVPGYLNKQFGINMMAAMAPLVTIYAFADIGSVGGGWLSSHLIKRGMRTLKARQIALLIMALCVVPVAMVSQVSSMWAAVLLISLAAAAHQGFAANLYTIVSDTVPANAVSSVVGLGGFAGGIMGMFMALAIGRILDATNGNYMVLFVAASVIYPSTVLVMHLILPKRGKTAAGIDV
ncbi:MFS transporter [Telmatospirillum siberiense]|uniref:MFS transporter n=1 Tax=Telmatospirillum siberiense TaxID=382514 RepID=A0A2N3Q0K7_9PROT|nr:MFS transporter [Telmatospirillum siberiense]PKU26183.1 MFS transporter [Telmatospirillum siberiense]